MPRTLSCSLLCALLSSFYYSISFLFLLNFTNDLPNRKGDAALSAVSNEAQLASLNENVSLNDRFGASFLSGSVISFLRPVTVLIVAGILSAVFANVNGNLAAQLHKEQNPWVFAVSAFLANLAWFAVLVVFANWLKNKMSAKNILRLRAVLLFGLLLFALMLFSRGILLATT